MKIAQALVDNYANVLKSTPAYKAFCNMKKFQRPHCDKVSLSIAKVMLNIALHEKKFATVSDIAVSHYKLINDIVKFMCRFDSCSRDTDYDLCNIVKSAKLDYKLVRALLKNAIKCRNVELAKAIISQHRYKNLAYDHAAEVYASRVFKLIKVFTKVVGSNWTTKCKSDTVNAISILINSGFERLSGHSYELLEIIDWLIGQGVNPSFHKKFNTTNVIVQAALVEKINHDEHTVLLKYLISKCNRTTINKARQFIDSDYIFDTDLYWTDVILGAAKTSGGCFPTIKLTKFMLSVSEIDLDAIELVCRHDTELYAPSARGLDCKLSILNYMIARIRSSSIDEAIMLFDPQARYNMQLSDPHSMLVHYYYHSERTFKDFLDLLTNLTSHSPDGYHMNATYRLAQANFAPNDLSGKDLEKRLQLTDFFLKIINSSSADNMFNLIQVLENSDTDAAMMKHVYEYTGMSSDVLIAQNGIAAMEV
jgi:hypothetical protein